VQARIITLIIPTRPPLEKGGWGDFEVYFGLGGPFGLRLKAK